MDAGGSVGGAAAVRSDRSAARERNTALSAQRAMISDFGESKIASWNINSLRKRQDRLLNWLREFQPDVVCLQETKCTDEQFPIGR